MARKPRTSKSNTQRDEIKEVDVKVTRSTNKRPSKRNKGYKKEEHLEERSNNPQWYFTDEKLADQVSQLSFQNYAGFPITYDGKDFDVPNVIRVALNPSPGVQLSSRYNNNLGQRSGINMAGFKLYSRLSAFTGRTQSYAPQDVSTMILAFGEVISIAECIRRMFGVAYTINMRNRDYPRTVLDFGMLVDADDLFKNLSDYRTRFNAIITLVNQLTIPKNVAYFDKCARLYERIYLDSPSSMAQSLILMPYTTWILDETSYSGGSILKTTPVISDNTFKPTNTKKLMSDYLDLLENMVTTLLNSTTLNIIYSDIMNMALKQSVDYWRLDYLYEGYTVFPEFDQNFLLQMHNSTIAGYPYRQTTLVTSPKAVTPYNDVYPDPNKNAVFYNPAFDSIDGTASGSPRTGNSALIDMLTDSPTLTDRVEVTRFTSIGKGQRFQATGQSVAGSWIDTALPDHYIATVEFEDMTGNFAANHYRVNSTLVPALNYADIATFVGNIAWAPRFFEVEDNSSTLTGHYTSDVNFYTVVDDQYIRKLHDFVGLALYDLR